MFKTHSILRELKKHYIVESFLKASLQTKSTFFPLFTSLKAQSKYYNILLFYLFEQVWDRIAPGLASDFDSPYSIPAIAPRPLLILNGKTSILQLQPTILINTYLSCLNVFVLCFVTLNSIGLHTCRVSKFELMTLKP